MTLSFPRVIKRHALVAALSCALLLPTEIHAQAASTALSGRVSAAASGDSLQGAIVKVLGTPYQDYTDSTGRFAFPSLPAGTYQIEIEYVGLDPMIQEVTVSGGSPYVLSAALESTALQMETMRVSAAARGQALAINQQRTASGIINIVSEETFGAMVDGNIGQALQRLPGISVDEDQDGSQGDINIRGISGEFNSFQIDGNRAPTSGGSRSFNPRQLAADGITNIEVIKAPTPDRDGDAIGGIINIVSRNAFQRDGRQIKLRASGVLNEEPNNWGYAGSLSYSDLFTIGASDKKNLGISFTASSHETDRYSRNADQDWVQVDPTLNPELGLAVGGPPTWFMESTHWEYATRTTTTQTINGSIDFRIDDENSFYFRPLFSHYDREGVTYETDIDIDTRFQNQAGGRKTYALLTPNLGQGTPSDGGSRGSMGWIGTDDDQYNDMYSLSFGGRHQRTSSVLNYDIYYSRSKSVIANNAELNMLMEPTDPWIVFGYEVVKPEGDVKVNILNGVNPTVLSLMSEGELIEETGTKVEEVFSAKLDWEKEFLGAETLFKLKTGAKHRVSSPRFDRNTLVHTMDDSFPYANVLQPTDQVLFLKPKYFDVLPRTGQELRQTNPELFELAEEDTLADSNLADYDAEETTNAAYVMGTLSWGSHSLIGGLRLEKNKWQNTNKRTSYLDGFPTVTSVNQGDSYSHWLPGLHFRHALTKNLILRESYNRSYGRPRLSELSKGRFIDEDGNIEDGNPDLKPATSDNFDVQLEYYTDQGGLYSVGFFYKDVKDFTFTQVYDFDVSDAKGIPIPAAGGEFEYERPVNGASAVNYGLELIARQRLFFLPGPLNGFSASVSATFTESDAEYPNRTDNRKLPLEGFSAYLFTASLDYSWKNFSARVDYRFRDDYIEGLGANIESDEYYAAEERVDAEIAYRVSEGLSVFANVTNFTERPQVSYQGYRPFVEDASFAGAKYTFGMEYEF